MATDTLRIGIIGAGANTRSRHIPGLRMQNSVEIVGVANRSVASSQKAAKELDIPKAYGDWTEISRTRPSMRCASAPGHTRMPR